jgi:magnesium chelatase subunit H
LTTLSTVVVAALPVAAVPCSLRAALYSAAARKLAQLAPHIQLRVFSDRDIASRRGEVAAALAGADCFFGSLLFDYDTVEWLRGQLAGVPVVLVFESALELMGLTRIGSFTMDPSGKRERRGGWGV